MKKQPIRDTNYWLLERSSLGGAWIYRQRAILLDLRDLEDPAYQYGHVGLRIVRNKR